MVASVATFLPITWMRDPIFLNFSGSLVDLRHDMTHGEMRTRDALLDGLASALSWTIKYYWNSEEKNRLLSNEGTC